MTELRILVCGDVLGSFKTLFNKISSIHEKKGPFEYLLCVGNFFGSKNEEWEEVLNGKIKVPLTTYVLGPNKPEHIKYFSDKSGELAPNIIHLGKRGVLTGCSGLKIAYLSGVESIDSTTYSFNKKDISELVSYSSQYGIDILLTPQWPHDVTKFAKDAERTRCFDSKLISFLAKEIKPRYHFSGLSEVFYERLPYRNHKVLQEVPAHVTRFIALAPVNNVKKQKWVYAFNITPYCALSSKQLATVSGPVTECPFENSIEDQINEFFYDTGSSAGKKKRHTDKEGHSQPKREKFLVSQENCWFCLGNPNVEKHLLISVADYSYLALPKGGLVEDHLLILPIEHIEATVNLAESAYNEIYEFKKTLAKYFDDIDKDVVFFERSCSSAHLQIQVVPVPKSMSSKIKDVVFELGSSHGMEFSEIPELALIKQIVPEKKSYFYFEIIKNRKISSKLIYIINKHIPIQFGRMVLCSKKILNLPERIEWKACTLSEDEERLMAESFRRKFKPYDFSL